MISGTPAYISGDLPDEECQRRFSAALLNPDQPHPADLKTWNGGDPQWRFRVYRNNVIRSLMDALGDTFPVTRALVGDEFFMGLSRAHVLANPPKSSVLAFYGEEFPQFVAGYEPARSLPYLSDVARLEMLHVRAFHAADELPLDPESFATLSQRQDELPSLGLLFHPSVHTLASPHAIVSIWQAHRGDGSLDIAEVDPQIAETALVVRRQLQTLVLKLTPASYVFIRQLQQGGSLQVALEEAYAIEPTFDVAATLTLLVQSHALTGTHKKTKSHAN